MYALNVAEDNRILSACIVMAGADYGEMPIVGTLPFDDEAADININNWLYVDGEYVYDPLPEPEPPTAQAVNIETRVQNVETKTAELEESLEMLLTGVTNDE